MTDEHDPRAEVLDEPACVAHVRLRTVVRRLRPLAAPVASEVKRGHASVRGQQRRDEVPSMRVRASAVQENKCPIVGVAAPIQIVKLETLDLEVSMSRLRRSGSRLEMRHQNLS